MPTDDVTKLMVDGGEKRATGQVGRLDASIRVQGQEDLPGRKIELRQQGLDRSTGVCRSVKDFQCKAKASGKKKAPAVTFMK
jgi:hypothetical protein